MIILYSQSWWLPFRVAGFVFNKISYLLLMGFSSFSQGRMNHFPILTKFLSIRHLKKDNHNPQLLYYFGKYQALKIQSLVYKSRGCYAQELAPIRFQNSRPKWNGIDSQTWNQVTLVSSSLKNRVYPDLIALLNTKLLT